MSKLPSFKVYNASAGAGKTYTLVREYISTLLQLSSSDAHRHLLAVTFTNKAVAEMKERVVSTLLAFSEYPDGNPSPMLTEIATILNTTPENIAYKAQTKLDQILNNYASFDIVTLDTLTHRILRTFSKDLGLAGNFEVTLDTKDLLQRAVDRLIDKTGEDAQLTSILVSFALEKANDDKSWNITKDLIDIAQLLVKENDRKHIAALGEISQNDFKALQEQLNTDYFSLKAKIESKATALLQTLTQHQLEKLNFSGGYYYVHVERLSTDANQAKFTSSAWQSQITEGSYSYYKAKEDQTIKTTINTLKPQLDDFFTETKQLYSEMMFLKDLSKKVIPLSVLHRIHQEVEAIKSEENSMLISDFNEHIFKHLSDEPAAFIYERIGERYLHFFIDEFQDTSTLQWNNLIPLIENALSMESNQKAQNSLMIVGDPKQAIYRWRGGKAEQFIDLFVGRHPFSVAHSPQALPKNYRSHKEIIEFNNSFFKYVSRYFNNDTYKELYSTSSFQKVNHRKGGVVNISFINASNTVEANELYPPRVLEIIEKARSDGFDYGDMCVLTRKNSHGSLLASFLAENNIKVISNDSLLIASSKAVNFIDNLLQLISQPDTPELTLSVLQYLVNHLEVSSKSSFLDTHVHMPSEALFKTLNSFGISFDIDIFHSLTLYEAVEYIIRNFHLTNKADAYVTAYLQVVLDFSQKENTGLRGFLSYWVQKKGTLSIAIAPQMDAVQLMSIHKSKGLEFPIVIYPYADTDLYDKRDYHWYPLEQAKFQGFSHLLVSHKKELGQYSDIGEALYTQRHEQHLFDAVNVLYVGLTRAVRRLYVVSRFRESVKLPITNHLTIADIFLNYLHETEGFHPSQFEITKGCAEPTQKAEIQQNTTTLSYVSTSKEEHNVHIVPRAAFLWDETRQEAITYGNLIHTLMAQLRSRDQIDFVTEAAVSEGLLPEIQKNEILDILTKVVSHDSLAHLYDSKNTVYCERALLTEDGSTFIPDRIEVTPENLTYIIDYKTGEPQESHKFQVENYSTLLGQMGHNVQNKFLVYLNQDVNVLTM